MAVSAKDVKRLRDLTGVGMMDCKKALEEADGDFEQAVADRAAESAAARLETSAAEIRRHLDVPCEVVVAADGGSAQVVVETARSFYGRAPRRLVRNPNWSIPYRGQPYFVSEFGGIWWNPEAAEGEDSWGYGERPQNIEEFYERFERLCAILLNNPHMFGYCYTQLTDVYQEQNGIYRFDRRSKFDMERIRAAQQRPAAIEQQSVPTG